MLQSMGLQKVGHNLATEQQAKSLGEHDQGEFRKASQRRWHLSGVVMCRSSWGRERTNRELHSLM